MPDIRTSLARCSEYLSFEAAAHSLPFLHDVLQESSLGLRAAASRFDISPQTNDGHLLILCFPHDQPKVYDCPLRLRLKYRGLPRTSSFRWVVNTGVHQPRKGRSVRLQSSVIRNLSCALSVLAQKRKHTGALRERICRASTTYSLQPWRCFFEHWLSRISNYYQHPSFTLALQFCDTRVFTDIPELAFLNIGIVTDKGFNQTSTTSHFRYVPCVVAYPPRIAVPWTTGLLWCPAMLPNP
jgi:hypothetical protein